jgi:hypothetical protein
MAAPTPYNRLYSFTDFQTVNPSRPLPGTELDAELNAVKLTSDQTRTNLNMIQRDDGALANQVVSPESLSAGTLALIAQAEYRPRGEWVGLTEYAVGDVVEYNLATYLALVDHTSLAAFPDDLAAGRWLLIANGALSGSAAAVDLFEGDGVETVYTLSVNYSANTGANVFVNGVAQTPGQAFTIVNNQLTFVVAPPAPAVPGNLNVMVRGTAVEVQLAASSATQAALDAEGFRDAAAISAATAQAAALDPNVVVVGSDLLGANTIGTVAGIAADVTAVAGDEVDIGIVATNIGNVNAVGGNIAAVLAVDANEANINTVAGNLTGANTIGTVAGLDAEIAALGPIAADITAVATLDPSDLATVAVNVTDITNYADTYLGPKTADPTLRNDGSALQAGDLYFNTATQLMKVYTGSMWQDVAQGVSTPYQVFSGTASQTAYTLSAPPGSLGSTEVYLNGVRQLPATDYTLSGTTLTFLVAPPAGTGNIFVRWISTQAINVPALESVGQAQVAPSYDATLVKKTATTGSAVIPAGTEAQRDGAPAAGYFRFNTTLAKFEGYTGTAWGSVGGGATGGGSDAVFHLNDQEVTVDYTIPADQNAGSFGPIEIATGVTVTVSAGATWSVI